MTLDLEFEREKRKSWNEGKAEGKMEGKVESIKSLMETMSFTAEQAMKALKIPADDFAKYRAVL